jgi:hypothetical protein
MKHYVIGLLVVILIVALVLGMSSPMQEGINTDRLTSVITILKMSSVSKEQQFDMIKTIGIGDTKYANVINNRSLSKSEVIDKLRDILKKDGVNV